MFDRFNQYLAFEDRFSRIVSLRYGDELWGISYLYRNGCRYYDEPQVVGFRVVPDHKTP